MRTKATYMHYTILHFTVPLPSVSISTLSDQTVGQSLTLKCNITIIRGITSRLDIIWSSDDIEVKRTEGINTSLVTINSVLYTDLYEISQLSTSDEDKTFMCKSLIIATSPVVATSNITLNVTGKFYIIIQCWYSFMYIILFYIVPDINITMSPSGPIQGAMVGSPQDIQCIVSTVSGVELSSVMISWMGPGEESITNDSRVTISPTTSSGNNYTSSLQFTYLMEGDEGMYTCNVMILETKYSAVTELDYLTGKTCFLTF